MAGNPLIDVFQDKRSKREDTYLQSVVLIVFRIGATILPIPGININALKLYFSAQDSASPLGNNRLY